MNTRKRQSGFTLIELLIVVAIILIIAAIAVPNMLRSRATANAASAAGTMRSISTAMQTYASTYPTLGFPATMSLLGGTACGGTVTPLKIGSQTACLLDNTFATTGVKGPYTFTYTPGTAAADGTIGNYQVVTSTTDATLPNYYVDETNVVRVAQSGGTLDNTSPAL